MTYLTRATAAAGALLAAALLPAGPAQAAPPDRPIGSWLYLTVTRGEARTAGTHTGGRPGGAHGTLLLCDPSLEHGHAAEACAELAAADGDIGRIPVKKDAVCSLLYAPVTARAHGQWQGRPVDYQETFANSCVMAARTGSVFTLDG
ncbi:SSI family serine proteinase inhibitor [Streptomyces sp. NPDC006739]|uniref:SSI family serine proteinase inhibitor n=1 Tax=Streptomyces sp. NPDC006739 TaxID=3364763 RepID=UPI0036C9C510